LEKKHVALLLISGLTIMSGATIAPALPAIHEQFKDVANINLIVRFILTVPALVVVLVAPFAGGLSDRFGRKGILILAIVLFGIAGTSGAFLNSIYMIILSRAIVGLSIAFIMTISTALVGDYFPPGVTRDSFVGRQGAFFGVGGLIFLTLGGFLAEIGWRAPFAVYATALFLPYFAYKHLEDVKGPGTTMRSTLQNVAGYWRQAVIVTLAFSFFNSMTFYLLPTQLPFLIKEMNIGTAGFSGIAIGTSTLISSLSSLSYSKLRSKFKPKILFFGAFLLMAIAYKVLAHSNSKTMIVAAMVVAGVGMGILLPNFIVTTMGYAPEQYRGRVAGGLTTSIFLGQFISPFLSQPWAERFSLRVTFQDTGILLSVIAIASLVWGQFNENRHAKELI